MISTLIFISVLQLSALVLSQEEGLQMIADELTIILLMVLLYCKGSFQHNHIKVFIITLIIFMGVIFTSRLVKITSNSPTKSNALQINLGGTIIQQEIQYSNLLKNII